MSDTIVSRSRRGTDPASAEGSVEHGSGSVDTQRRTPTRESSDSRLNWRAGDPDPEDDGAGSLVRLAAGQVGWMLLVAGVLTWLEMFSTELYFTVSFIGLLVNKVLHAPQGDIPRWWWVVELLTWAGFAVLVYFTFLRIQEVLAAA